MSELKRMESSLQSMDKKFDLTERDKNELYLQFNNKLNTSKRPAYKKYKYYLAATAASIIFIILTLPSILSFLDTSSSHLSNSATSITEKEVENIVIKYLTAMEEKDIETMVKYTDDIRFPDKSIQEEQYKDMLPQEVTDTEIIDLTMVNNNEFEVIIELVANDFLERRTFPVLKKDGEWRIIVGQDLDLAP
ncbi:MULTISPECIES: hypothetical protein [Bacillaceae]|uniref:DUF4878 domain-containing protein n=1 Tax=Evansella alkalicola TaxID=745819 RepID=A0ABS6JUK6_9BACI|nr:MULTISPECIES: hypothetical protein [Bacillaceae]MBU9721942.1 hypothetical protein [Bacillus alkalicola]